MVADFKMNPEKLKQMQANVRIGGKGTARRKKKVVHRTATTDDKKLQSSLKKLSGTENKNFTASQNKSTLQAYQISQYLPTFLTQ